MLIPPTLDLAIRYSTTRPAAVIRKLRTWTWKLGIGLLPTGVFYAARWEVAESVATDHVCIGRNTFLDVLRLADGKL
jgi:hypothetical protein